MTLTDILNKKYERVINGKRSCVTIDQTDYAGTPHVLIQGFFAHPTLSKEQQGAVIKSLFTELYADCDAAGVNAIAPAPTPQAWKWSKQFNGESVPFTWDGETAPAIYRRARNV